MGDLTGSKGIDQNGKRPMGNGQLRHQTGNGPDVTTGNGGVVVVPNGDSGSHTKQTTHIDSPIEDTFYKGGAVGDDSASMTSSAMDSDESGYESSNCVHRFQASVSTCTSQNSTTIKNLILFAMFIGYSIYLGFAIAYDAQLAQSLIIITACVVFLIIYSFISDKFGDAIYNNCMKPCWKPIGDRWHVIQW